MPKLIAIDVETGGLQVGTHALLQVAAVPSWEGPEPFEVKIWPGDLMVEQRAAELNGYTNERWAQAGAVDAIVAVRRFEAWVREIHAPGVGLLAHNASFDRAWVDWWFSTCGLPRLSTHMWRCSMMVSLAAQDAELMPVVGASLDALCRVAGIERGPAHDALADARACLRGYFWLLGVMGKGETAEAER